MSQNLLITIIMILLASNSFSQEFTWDSSNGPYGGDVLSIASNGDSVLFAGMSVQNEFYRSIDNGYTWNLSNSGMDEEDMVSSIFVHPSGCIFAGGSKIYRSSDLGETWEKLTIIHTIRGFTINDTGAIFIATEGAGAYFSPDTGNTWIQINNGLPTFVLMDIIYHPDGYIFAASDLGVFRLDDINGSWAQVKSGEYTRTLEINSTGMLFAGTCNGLYRTSDYGASWTAVNNGLISLNIQDIVHTNNDTLFVTEGSIYISTNNGDSWEIWSTWLYSGAFVLCADTAGNIFAGSRSGFFRYDKVNQRWPKSDYGIAAVWVNAIVTTQNGTLIAGTERNGIFRSIDDGQSWRKDYDDLVSDAIHSMAVHPNGYIFATGANGIGVYYSSDDGISWEATSNDFLDLSVRCIVINHAGDIFIDGVNRSTDLGENWTELFPAHLSGIDVTSTDILFAATVDSGVYRSMDNGDNWERKSDGIESLFMGSLTVDENDNIYAGTYDGDMYLSTDLGETWIDITSDQMNSPINTIISYDESDLFSGLEYTFAPQTGGIYHSIDQGANWEKISQGILNQGIEIMHVHNNGNLFIGTAGGSIVQSHNSITNVNEHNNNLETSKSFYLTQNYPNPFNPITKINYTLKIKSHVNLSIYDVAGREIKKLVNHWQNAGKYSVTFGAFGLASGIYIYTLKAGTFEQSRKMLLLR